MAYTGKFTEWAKRRQEIVRRLDAGERSADLAVEYGVRQCTIQQTAWRERKRQAVKLASTD